MSNLSRGKILVIAALCVVCIALVVLMNLFGGDEIASGSSTALYENDGLTFEFPAGWKYEHPEWSPGPEWILILLNGPDGMKADVTFSPAHLQVPLEEMPERFEMIFPSEKTMLLNGRNYDVKKIESSQGKVTISNGIESMKETRTLQISSPKIKSPPITQVIFYKRKTIGDRAISIGGMCRKGYREKRLASMMETILNSAAYDDNQN